MSTIAPSAGSSSTSRWRIGSAYRDDDLARRATRAEERERGGNLGKGDRRVHEWVDRTARVQRGELGRKARQERVVAGDRATEVHSDHAVVLHQHVIGGNF